MRNINHKHNKAMRKVNQYTLIVLLILSSIIFSCSGQWHLRKALKKDPSIIMRDTVSTIDTVWVEVQNIDTVFKYNYTDTVIIQNKDSVIVKYFYNQKDSTVYLSADCPDCPKVTETKTIENIYRVEPSFWEKTQRWIGTIMLAGVVVFLMIYIIKNR